MRARVLASLFAPLALGAAAAQEPGSRTVETRGRTLAGIVTDTARNPIPGVEVGLLVGREIARSMRTDSTGRFEFRDLPGGPTSILARRLGFHPRVYTVRIRAGATRAFLPVVLDPMPAELEKVIVLARVANSRGRLREFYERKARSGWGHYIEREDIERRNPLWMSDMLRMVPGVRVVPLRSGRNGIRFRGGCRAAIWLDGMPIRGVELDEIVYPSDVAAVEVYSRGGTPVQFAYGGGCGAVVVWTRDG